MPTAKKTTTTAKKPAAKSTTKVTKTTTTKTTKATAAKPKTATTKTTTTVSTPVKTQPTPAQQAAQARHLSKWQGIWALILGLLALFFFWLPILSIPLAIIGFIFGCLSLKTVNKGMGIAGIITSVLSAIFSVILIVFAVQLVGNIFDDVQDIFTDDQSTSSTNLNSSTAANSADASADTQIGQLMLNYLAIVDQTPANDIALTDYSDTEGQDLIMAEVNNQQWLGLAEYTDDNDLIAAILMHEDVYVDDVDLDFIPSASTPLSVPTTNTIAQLNQVETLFTSLMPNYTFVSAQAEQFTTAADQVLTAGGTYIARPDGYAQATLLGKASGQPDFMFFAIFDQSGTILTVGLDEAANLF